MRHMHGLQAIDAIRSYKEQGLPLNRCTVATDGFGSWPVYDKQGKLISYEVRGALLRHFDFYRDLSNCSADTAGMNMTCTTLLIHTAAERLLLIGVMVISHLARFICIEVCGFVGCRPRCHDEVYAGNGARRGLEPVRGAALHDQQCSQCTATPTQRPGKSLSTLCFCCVWLRCTIG